MNLHGIVRGAIQSVNPDIPVVVRRSVGATQDASGRSIPGYAAPVQVMGQKQELTGKDIFRLQGQNVQGVDCKMYLNGNIEGLIRADGRGGDLLEFEGRVYLVKSVLERWPDWCSLALTMQLDQPII